MIVIKTKKGELQEYLTEAILASGALVWGIIILLTPSLFNSFSYEVLLAIMPRDAWAWMAILVGVFRLVVLTAGHSYNCKFKPHLRAISAGVSMTLWASLFIISLLNFPDRGSGAAIFAMPLILDFSILWYSAGDAKLQDKAKNIGS